MPFQSFSTDNFLQRNHLQNDSDSEDDRSADDRAVFNAPWHTMTPDADTRDSRGRTKLHLEAKFGTNVSFNDVLGQVTDIDAVLKSQDHDGNTPLHMALWAKSPNHSIIKLLLASGSDVNIKNAEGYTPFHILFWRAPVGGMTIHHPDLLLAFLGDGADTSIPTPTGSLPFEIFLNDYFTNSMSLGSSAVNYPVFEAFLAKGGDPNTKMSGEYMLNQYLRHEILKRPEKDKCWQIAKLLCEHANVNQVGTNGEYPIHEAVRNVQHHSHTELVSILLNRGANPNQPNASGELPLTSFLCATPEPSEIANVISIFGEAGVAALHLRSAFFTALRLYEGDLRRKLIRLILLIEVDSTWSDSLGDLNKWWIAWRSACLQQQHDWFRARNCLVEAVPALSLTANIEEVVMSSAREILALRCLGKAKEDIQALDTGIMSEDALRERCDSAFAMLADFREKAILVPDMWCDLLLQLYTLRSDLHQ